MTGTPGNEIRKQNDTNKVRGQFPGKSYLEYRSNGNNITNPELARQLQFYKGNGIHLPGKFQSEMENKMGQDFDNVRVHKDNKAVRMSRNLGAKAFTHGNDIYFNDNEYNPISSSGKHLLVHELTHVVQQSKVNTDLKIIQGSFFGDVWKGIKKAGKAVGHAAK